MRFGWVHAECENCSQSIVLTAKAMISCEMQYLSHISLPSLISTPIHRPLLSSSLPCSSSIPSTTQCIILTIQSLLRSHFSSLSHLPSQSAAPSCKGVTLDASLGSTLTPTNLPYTAMKGEVTTDDAAKYTSWEKLECSK